jgi:hypothetical protein
MFLAVDAYLKPPFCQEVFLFHHGYPPISAMLVGILFGLDDGFGLSMFFSVDVSD